MAVPAQLKHGSRVAIKLGYGGYSDTVATMGVDGIIDVKNGMGRQFSVTGRGWATKMLSQWNSDSSYDYWSQAKYANDPKTREENIVASGKFSELDNVCIGSDAGSHNIMYSVANPSRGALAKAKFSIPNDANFKPRYGFILNFYQESKAEAAQRTGKKISELADGDYGYYGIGVVLGKTEHTGGANGVGIYHVERSTWTKLTSFSQSITHTVEHWLAASYDDGVVTVYYRLGSTSTWTTLGTYTFSRIDTTPNPDVLKLPSYREGVGRTALYLYNGGEVPFWHWGFSSTSKVIPAITTDPALSGALVAGCTITVDGEDIKTGTITKNGEMSTIPFLRHIGSQDFQGAPNGYWGLYMSGKSPMIMYPGSGTNASYKYASSTTGLNGMAIIPQTMNNGVPYSYGYPFQNPWSDNSIFEPKRIVGYEAGAADWWAPNVAASSPGDWRHYVGNASYGAWTSYANVVANPVVGYIGCCKFYVDGAVQPLKNGPDNTDTSSWVPSLAQGALYRIVDGIEIAGRGQNGTAVADHKAGGYATIGTTSRVKCHWWEVYTSEADMTFEWVARQLCGRAGITSFSSEKAATGSKAFSARAGWDLSTDISTSKTKPGFVLDFSVTSGTETGVFAIETGGSAIGTTSGSIVTISSGNIRYYDVVNGTSTLKENVSYTGRTWTTGGWRFSAQDKYISVWHCGKLMASFYTGRNVISGCTVANGAATIVLDWPELDKRIDNFIFDMGSSGEELLRRLIGEKRIFYLDDQTGGIKFFKNRTVVNTSPTADTMCVEAGDASYDTSVITRIRLEGAEAVELLDATGMTTFGNLFALANSSELETVSAFNDEAALMLTDAIRSANGTTYIGAADLRLEPQDRYWVVIDGSPKEVIVRQCDIKYQITQNSALLDMQFSGDDV